VNASLERERRPEPHLISGLGRENGSALLKHTYVSVFGLQNAADGDERLQTRHGPVEAEHWYPKAEGPRAELANGKVFDHRAHEGSIRTAQASRKMPPRPMSDRGISGSPK
jgi:hypothetical protein